MVAHRQQAEAHLRVAVHRAIAAARRVIVAARHHLRREVALIVVVAEVAIREARRVALHIAEVLTQVEARARVEVHLRVAEIRVVDSL